MLFMAVGTFSKRMRFLSESGYNVISLSEAVRGLRTGELPPCPTVITIDDGWFGTLAHMAPILKRHGFPSTLYLSTYYVQTRFPVFNVAVSYVLWKSKVRFLEMNHIDSKLYERFDLQNDTQRIVAYEYLLSRGESAKNGAERQALLRSICSLLQVDFGGIESLKQFFFLSEKEAAEVMEFGVDLQLHTHRHRFPQESIELAKKEIGDNAQVLGRIGSSDLVHFCFPSGSYSLEQLAYLPRLGIQTAVTTKPGLNKRGCSLFELKRFLDSEDKSMLEFEAEICGFKDLAKTIVRPLVRRGSKGR